MNRIIEVKVNKPIIDKTCGSDFIEILRANYGHAGKLIIDALKDADVLADFKEQYHAVQKTIVAKGITGKQANAAAAIYIGDALLDYAVFHDGIALNEVDLAAALKTNKDIDINIKAWEFLKGKIAENENRFASVSDIDADNKKIANYVGRFLSAKSGCLTCILQPVFDKWMQRGGYNPKTLEEWMTEQGYLETEQGRYNKAIYMPGGTRPRCICIRNDALNEE